MVEQGFIVAGLGMSIVFGFLALLVLMVNALSKIVIVLNKYFPEENNETVTKQTVNNDAEAIALAVALVKRQLAKGE